jgi:murein DD-endopeptidase MepM/ murein hydrolase activator NlpD
VRPDDGDDGAGRAHGARSPLCLTLLWLVPLAAALAIGRRARAETVEPGAPPGDVAAEHARATRDVATLAAREALLGEQSEAARASARWRLRALYRLAVAGDELPRVTRARALDAGARALGGELAEARALVAERTRARAERATLVAAAAAEPEIGAAPVFVQPVAGPVIARFGVWPERATGLLVSRAGVRLGALPRQGVRASAAGTVVAATAEPEGISVVLDHGAGWTTIVGGLATIESGVVVGARVAGGQRLGAAGVGPAPCVRFEVWRGRRPVDPSLLARPGATALATPARLP